MARVRIPKDTPTFTYRNENPDGIHTSDCVVRAIAAANGMTWEEVFDGLAEVARELHTMPNDRTAYEKYLKSLGWVRRKQMKHADGTKYSGSEFARAMGDRNIICHIGVHHLTCIIGGRVNDIWDCSSRKVGIWWERKG